MGTITSADFEKAKQEFTRKVEKARAEYEEKFQVLLSHVEEKKIDEIRKDLHQQ